MNNAINNLNEIRNERLARKEAAEGEAAQAQPREGLLARIIKAIENAFAGQGMVDPHAMA